MTGRAWFDRFAAEGPEYRAQRMSVAELQALLLKAGIGDGMPLGHAQDLSALAPFLMSDPQLLGMAAAALDGDHKAPGIEGTDDHVVIERASLLMAGPMAVDRLVVGASRVILHGVDWPMLLWPYLAHAEAVYDLKFEVVRGGDGAVMVSSAAQSGLDAFGNPQAVPSTVTERLSRLAAKTYVPASEASRIAGAGAGLTDND